MASGVIQKTNVDGGTGYTKLPDGTLIQWGKYSVHSGSFAAVSGTGIYYLNISFNFPIPFVGNPIVTGTSRYSTGFALPVGFNNASATTAVGYAYDFSPRTPTTQVPLIIEWQAVGKWK